jgi:hypothetical protein
MSHVGAVFCFSLLVCQNWSDYGVRSLAETLTYLTFSRYVAICFPTSPIHYPVKAVLAYLRSSIYVSNAMTSEYLPLIHPEIKIAAIWHDSGRRTNPQFRHSLLVHDHGRSRLSSHSSDHRTTMWLHCNKGHRRSLVPILKNIPGLRILQIQFSSGMIERSWGVHESAHVKVPGLWNNGSTPVICHNHFRWLMIQPFHETHASSRFTFATKITDLLSSHMNGNFTNSPGGLKWCLAVLFITFDLGASFWLFHFRESVHCVTVSENKKLPVDRPLTLDRCWKHTDYQFSLWDGILTANWRIMVSFY